jgi:hypothetical protein
VLRQPIFGNPLIINTTGNPLGVSGLNEGNVFAKSGCTKLKDLWDPEGMEWKSLFALRLSYHAHNRTSREIITIGIPWDPATYPN